MQEEMSGSDLKERFALIEGMIAEGRRSTESWGWVFVLWGVAYLVAIVWASWGAGQPGGSVLAGTHSDVAWPVTMFSAAVLTLAIGLRRGRRKMGTLLGRSVISVWAGIGISMLVVFPALGFSGRLSAQIFVALVAAMLGAANGASGMILRWKMQTACAVVWWVACAVACFGTEAQTSAVFLSAVFVCQIVFGVYVMVRESQRERGGLAHA